VIARNAATPDTTRAWHWTRPLETGPVTGTRRGRSRQDQCLAPEAAAPDRTSAWHQARLSRTRPVPGTSLSIVVLAAVALLASGCGGDDDQPAVPLGRHVAASRMITPSAHLFGDTIKARVDVVVDRDHLDPDRVRLEAAFPPYELVRKTQVERRDHDRYTRLRYSITLRCLGRACLAGEVSPGITPAGGQPPSRRAERIFHFRPAHLYYDEPDEEKPRHLRRVWWPRLEALTRISPSEPGLSFALRTPFRTTISSMPDVTYRISPALLGTGLLLLAGLLLALPGWFTWSWFRSRRKPPPVEEAPELTPLERALVLVDQARDSVDGENRRKALEVLAVELDEARRAEHAEEARRLAWSPSEPTPEAAGNLVESVRKSDAA
jgi:hypothetical protein